MHADRFSEKALLYVWAYYWSSGLNRSDRACFRLRASAGARSEGPLPRGPNAYFAVLTEHYRCRSSAARRMYSYSLLERGGGGVAAKKSGQAVGSVRCVSMRS